jgi:hypothetical protein
MDWYVRGSLIDQPFIWDVCQKWTQTPMPSRLPNMEHCCVCPSLRDGQIHRFSEARAIGHLMRRLKLQTTSLLPAINDANLLTENEHCITCKFTTCTSHIVNIKTHCKWSCCQPNVSLKSAWSLTWWRMKHPVLAVAHTHDVWKKHKNCSYSCSNFSPLFYFYLCCE